MARRFSVQVPVDYSRLTIAGSLSGDVLAIPPARVNRRPFEQQDRSLWIEVTGSSATRKASKSLVSQKPLNQSNWV
jgi:hypothetical protein